MKVSDIVIQFLETKGISHVFVISGGGCIHLVDSLGKADKLKYVCMHHEQALAMAAEGYARIKNDIGACIVTTGPGGTNALTGVLGCWLDSIPALFISGQVPSSQISEATGCRQIGDQEFDIISTVKSMTKYCKMIKNKTEILYELNKAYDIAKSGRPGPVWLDIPLDIQGSYVEEDELKIYKSSEIIYEIDQPILDQFKYLIENSKKPLIVCGNGVRLSDSYDILDKFIKQNKIPILTGVHSGVDCVDNSYEYYAGRIGLLGNISSNKIVQDADLLIALGTRLNVKMTGYDTSLFSPNSKKIYIDIDENEIKKHKFNIDLPIVTDLKSFLTIISNQKYNLDIDDWRNFVKSSRAEQRYVYPKHINLQTPASAYYFLYTLQKYINDLPIVTSNGTAHVVTLQTIQLKNKQRMFTNVGCASMGYGLPAAIGASFASNSPVVCVEGDGSLQMNIQELQTLVHYNIPVILFVINNDGYISIKITQQNFFQGYQVASGKESGISFPCLEKISSAYGIPYFKIDSNKKVEETLSNLFALEVDGPIICEIFTHPNEKHEPKVIHKGVDKDGKIIPGDLSNMFITDTFEN